MNEPYIPEWKPVIPARFQKAKYEDVPEDVRQAFEKIRETGRGLYIYGAVGTGKTHIAYTLYANSAEKAKIWARFINVTELLRDMKTDFDRVEKHYPEEDLMTYKGILFLDDLGSEKLSDWVLETFYLIINKRYNEMRPTIFTSNFRLPELEKRIGDRIVSRIVEMCDRFEIKGQDRRLCAKK